MTHDPEPRHHGAPRETPVESNERKEDFAARPSVASLRQVLTIPGNRAHLRPETMLTLAGTRSRRHGITETTFYRWKAKFGGMEVSDARRLGQLEDENQRLKHLVAELTLDNQALKGVLDKKW